jgi:AcrR family transcriptional regulator
MKIQAEAPRRGRPPKIARETIIEAALAIADLDGLDALSMRRLADALGVAPRSLYGYVETKEELLDLLGEVALASLAIDDDLDSPWEEQLLRALMSLYRELLLHPSAGELILGPRVLGAAPIDRLRERILGLIRTVGGFDRNRAIQVTRLLIGQVVGLATVEAARAKRSTASRSHLETLPAAEFPETTAGATRWVMPLDEELVERSLRALIEVHLQQRLTDA